jgi:ribosomal protein L32
MLACVLAIAGLAAPALAAGCPGCDKVTQTGQGFCCGQGQTYGVKLTSQKLFDSLEGKTIDKAKIECPGCKEAAAKGGSCEHCKAYFHDGKAYQSKIAVALAKGEPVSAEKAATCPSCKTAHQQNTQCTACGVGFVAGRMYKGEDYKTALAAHEVLAKAVETSKKCEACAVAMVTDGECAHCKVGFKDGETVKKG